MSLVNAWGPVNVWSAPAVRAIVNIDSDNDVYAGQTGVVISTTLIDNPSTVQTVTLGGEALTITDWNNGQPIVTIPVDIDLLWGVSHTLVLTDDTGSVAFATPVAFSPPSTWEIIEYSGVDLDEATTDSFKEEAKTDATVGNFTAEAGDVLAFESHANLTVDEDTAVWIDPPVTVTGSYKFWDDSAGTWTPVSTFTWTDGGAAPSSVDIVGPDVEIYSVHIESHDAAMAHGSNFAMSVYSYDDVPDNTATLTTGSVVLNPTVTGSNPYTLTFPISRLDLQEGSYVWTLDINGETSDTSSLAYTIDGVGANEFYGTVTDQANWIALGYTEVVDGDNIYFIRTSGTGDVFVETASFPAGTIGQVYIQQASDDVWGTPATLTVPAADITAPVITLLGDATVTHAQQATYTDAGATASDDTDGDITADIVTVNPVDVDVVGSYTITYDVDDGAGNSATQVTRTVNVTDQEAPTITLVGSSTVSHAHGTTYTDAGATASDFNDGDVTADIVVVNPVNSSTLGAYTVTYNVDDAAGNSATEVTRTVNVTDQTAPVITLTGSASIEVVQGGTYTEQGATWADAIDGSGSATVGGDTVDESTLGTYVVTYNHTDSAGNAATQVTRSVEVVAAATAPTMPADASISVDEGTTAVGTYTASSGSSPITYTLTGTDASSFSIVEATGVVTFDSAPDYETKASYSINVVGTNSAGNDTQAVTVTINNVLEDAPTITTTGGTTLALEVGDTYSGDPAWTAADDVGSVTVDWSGDTVDTDTAGTYTRTASATNAIDTTTADYVVTVSEAGAAKVVQPTPLKVVVQRFAVSKVKSFNVYTANTRNLSFDFTKIVNEVGSSISTATFAIDSGSGVTLGESATEPSLAQVEFTTGSISGAAQVVCRAVFESGVELTAYATITVIDLPDL